MGYIEVIEGEGYLEIYLNRVGKANALSKELLIELADAFKNIDGLKPVILTSYGRHFSAGLDLEELYEGDLNVLDISEYLDPLYSYKGVLITVVKGACYGGGFDLALSGDVRIGVKDLKASIPPARLGLIYPWRGVKRMERRIGYGWIRYLILTGRILDWEELYRIGFIHEVYDSWDKAMDRAREIAGEIASYPPQVVKGLKIVLNSESEDEAVKAYRYMDREIYRERIRSILKR